MTQVGLVKLEWPASLVLIENSVNLSRISAIVLFGENVDDLYFPIGMFVKNAVLDINKDQDGATYPK